MLIATTSIEFGDSKVRTVIALARGLRVHLVWREQLVVDARFLARADRGRDVATLILGLEGKLRIGDAEHQGPRAYVLSPAEFDRVEPGAIPFRMWGDPSVTLEIGVSSDDVVGPIGLAAGPRAVGAETWAALEAMLTVALDGRPVDDALRRVFAGLITDRVLDPDVLRRASEPIPPHLSRLWTGIRDLYERNVTSASVREIMAMTGLSARQLRRDVGDFTKYFPLPGDGFRETVRVVRLRMAALMLSSPYATVTQVAEQVGYGTTIALARAFRDAKLPPPSEVQAQVRYGP
jgi:AraC-like DNA-binding protein